MVRGCPARKHRSINANSPIIAHTGADYRSNERVSTSTSGFTVRADFSGIEPFRERPVDISRELRKAVRETTGSRNVAAEIDEIANASATNANRQIARQPFPVLLQPTKTFSNFG